MLCLIANNFLKCFIAGRRTNGKLGQTGFIKYFIVILSTLKTEKTTGILKRHMTTNQWITYHTLNTTTKGTAKLYFPLHSLETSPEDNPAIVFVFQQNLLHPLKMPSSLVKRSKTERSENSLGKTILFSKPQNYFILNLSGIQLLQKGLFCIFI